MQREVWIRNLRIEFDTLTHCSDWSAPVIASSTNEAARMFAYLMRTSQAQIFELESPIIDEKWFNVRYIESLWSIFKSDLGY